MSFEPEDIEAARKLFAGPIAFLKSAPTIEFLPDAVVPEVAFAGRSNVGKSSLLNALTGRNALARTSKYLVETSRAPPKVIMTARDECPRCPRTQLLLRNLESILV